MGLDLYAGTLTRYYSGQWLTTVQQVAQEIGIPVTVTYAAGRPPWLSPEKAPVAVREFCVQLSKKWGSRFPYFAQAPVWNEDAATPYLVDKPDQDGVRSLVVVAAYLERSDLVRPKVLPADWENDPAYAEATDHGYYMGSMVVLEAHLFLPGDANFVIVQTDPLGARRYITSVGCLKRALSDVNARTWNAEPGILDSWRRRGLVPWGPVLKELRAREGKASFDDIVEEPNRVVDKLEHNAQFALACFWHLCEFAETHNVPIVVDQ